MNSKCVLVLAAVLASGCGSDDEEKLGTGGADAGGTGAAAGAGGTSGGAGGSDAGKTSETLAHHDASKAAGVFSPWVADAAARAEVAVRFTPSAYPATLKSVRVWVDNPSAGDVPFDLRGYADDGTLPTDTVLFTVAPKPIAKDQMDGYLDVDVPDTEVASGSFWIAVEWNPPPLGSQQGANSFYTITDVALDHPADHVTWANQWLTFTAAGYPIGDLYLEAIVEY